MNMSLPRHRWLLITILAFAVTPYFLCLGASSLWDSNEAFYAETPREMIASGDYVNPTFNYHVRLNKPPLSYWIVVPFYKLFGVSETSERLPIVLAAMVMIGTAFGLGRVLFSFEAGLLAAIGLAASPRFLMFSRRIMIDFYLAMFMALALFMFVLAQKRPERRRLYLLLMYACIGLGVITKGPVAAALPAIVLAIYFTFGRRLTDLRRMMLPTGLLVVALIVLPWCLAIYFQHGWGHIENFIIKDNLSRYMQPIWGPHRGILFYLPVVIGDFFPWSVFLLPLCWVALQRLWPSIREKAQPASAERRRWDDYALLLIWIAVIVAFFSLSRSKEDLYVLPIYPAAAALVGSSLSRWFGGKQFPRQSALRWTTFCLAAIIIAAAAVILFLFDTSAQPYRLAGTLLIGSVGIIGGITAAGGTIIKKTRLAILTTALTVIACNWVFVLRTLPDFERYRPVRALSEVIASEAGPEALVGYFRAAYPSMVFYLRRPIFEYVALGEPAAARILEQNELEAAFSSGKEVFCLMTATEYEAIKPLLPPETRVLASHPIFKVKLKGILDRGDLPQVVLISNKGGPNIAQ
jgi:4-amino-4-deoxy-L-arabinose transferase-like glycosyltransferase